MLKKSLEAIVEHFSKVTNPGLEREKEHRPIDMIVIAICAVIWGAEGWADIENFGNGIFLWLRIFLE